MRFTTRATHRRLAAPIAQHEPSGGMRAVWRNVWRHAQGFAIRWANRAYRHRERANRAHLRTVARCEIRTVASDPIGKSNEPARALNASHSERYATLARA